MRRWLAWAFAVCAGLTCSGGPEPDDVAPPTQPRASLILEPPSLRLGEIATLDLVVTTAPDFVPRPLAPPKQVPGLWLLDAETRPVEVVGRRWIHRTRLRIRARELGVHEWPASYIEVETPDGELVPIATDPLAIDVRAEIGAFEGRDAPFGILLPDDPPERAGSFAAGAVAGSLSVLLAGGLVGLARRRSRRGGDEPATRTTPAASPREPAWTVAHAELAELRTRTLDNEARIVCHLASGVLRRYISTRFSVDIESRTTEELRETIPPLGATTRWPLFVAIAADLDAVRFLPTTRSSQDRRREARRVAELVERIEAFVSDTTPDGIS